jgi:hypothetical protein
MVDWRGDARYYDNHDDYVDDGGHYEGHRLAGRAFR